MCYNTSKWYNLRPCSRGRGLVNICYVTFSVISGMGWIWSTNVEMHSVSSLAWDRFSQHRLRYIFCHCWHDTFWSTNVQMHFVPSVAWVGFRQHILRYILYPLWHGMVLFHTCWDTLHFLASMGWVWSHMLRYISCPRCKGRTSFTLVKVHLFYRTET